MDSITVLITGSGAPGIKGTIYSLENNFDNREIKIIGTDISEDVIGKYLCNKFYKIYKPESKEYLTELLSICENDHIDVILPQNTSELLLLAKYKKKFKKLGAIIAVSDEESLEIANNKYKIIKLAEKIGVPSPNSYLVDNFDDLIESAKKLGWPTNPVVVKPPISNGMRGVRIIDESVNLKNMFYFEKPTGLYLTMNNLKNIINSYFPELLVMEYLSNDEYTVDILSADTTIVIPRKRDKVKSGITFNGTVEKDEEIIEYSEKLSKNIGLKYAYGFQFKRDSQNIPKLLESNPRIQGTMVLSTFAGANLIYGAVKYSLDEDIPEFNIRWGTRIMRYWGGIGTFEDKLMGYL
jgi:carbamoyl-phosphate synthase large subunit